MVQTCLHFVLYMLERQMPFHTFNNTHSNERDGMTNVRKFVNLSGRKQRKSIWEEVLQISVFWEARREIQWYKVGGQILDHISEKEIQYIFRISNFELGGGLRVSKFEPRVSHFGVHRPRRVGQENIVFQTPRGAAQNSLFYGRQTGYGECGQGCSNFWI